MLSSHRDQVKLVHVLVSHTGVDNGTGQRILKCADLTIKDSSVDTLAAIDVHQLARVLTTSLDECRLDLFDLRNTDALHLAFTDTVSVENNPGRVSAIVLFEAFQGFDYTGLQRGGAFLANFILDDTRGPVSCSRLIHGGREREDGLLTKRGAVEHIHTTNHGRFLHKRQIVNSPRNTSNFGVHLDQHFADDRAKILALRDCTDKNHLRRDRELSEKELLHIIVKRALTFLTR